MFFSLNFHKNFLKRLSFGKPEILKINFVLKLKIENTNKGKDVTK